MMGLYEKNLEALNKRFPGMDKLIEEKKDELLQKENLDVESEINLEGREILKVQRNNRTLYLAGKRSASLAAANQIKFLGKIEYSAPLFMVGIGNGCYLEELFKEVPKKNDNMVMVYEPSFSIFYEQLFHVDIEELFEDRIVALLVEGINEEGIKPLIKQMLRGDRVSCMRHFILPNYNEICPEKVLDFQKVLKDVAEEYLVNINTVQAFSKVAVENMLKNADYVRTGYQAKQLMEAIPREMPAIIVSAGPSLNKNIEELKKAKNIATEALQTAENANKAKTDFLSNVSHDIRTPMNAIVGITALIRHNAGDKVKVLEYVDKIDISAQHLLGIINNVLDMSKIEAGKTAFQYTDFSISDLLQDLNAMFHSQVEEKNQTLTITKEKIRHEWVNGDQVHLMQIFSNLLSNAVKYTQEGGAIHFVAEECETASTVYARYRFFVRDNGMGMSDAFKDTIFDAFTRAENSVTNKIQGTGLGMAITKNLVEAMGGTIDVDSELGQGSCFEVLMDLKIAEDRTVALAAQEETDEQDGNILQGMRFLCAEDNELNAEILTELLKIEGAECTICENGEEILKAFEQSAPGDYDMILMDVQMPVMNGYEATKAIRRSSHELAKKIPIIAMTANAFSEDIQHSLAAGMNAHVSKPVEMKVLEKTIRSIKSGGGHRNAGH